MSKTKKIEQDGLLDYQQRKAQTNTSEQRSVYLVDVDSNEGEDRDVKNSFF